MRGFPGPWIALSSFLLVPGRKRGQKATTESLHEFIYPTEFESASGSKPDEKPKAPPATSFPCNPATPTAFDTRNVGSNLEVEPTLSENGILADMTRKVVVLMKCDVLSVK